MRAVSSTQDTVKDMHKFHSILFGSRQRSRFPRPARSRKGAALIVTVLLAVATATIALVAVRIVLGSAGEDLTRRNLDSATRAADAARSDVRAALVLDPEVIYREVLADEPRRICANDSSLTLTPGTEWPARCGSSWEYAATDPTSAVVVKISPPTPSDPLLTVSVVARVGEISAGFVDTYRIGGATRPNMFSGGALDLSKFSKGDGVSVLKGTLYASSTLNFDPNADTTYALLASESGVANLESYPEESIPAVNGRRVALAEPDLNSTPQRMPLRALFSTPLPKDGLRASATILAQRACPTGATPVNVEDKFELKRSSTLCLQEGAQLVTTADESVTVPQAKEWLLLPNATTSEQSPLSSTIDLYYRTSSNAVECTGCDLRAASTTSLSIGTHPGQITAWTKLATSYLPISGYIGTDATTHIGLCGVSFTTTSQCTTWGSGEHEGALIKESFTVIAGSVTRPRDIFLSGPITSQAASARIGAFATGDIRVPYWAAPKNGALNLDIDIAVVGRGEASAITTFPRSASSAAANSSGTLSLRGSLAGTNLSASISPNIFAGFELRTPTPNYLGALTPVPDLIWGRVGTHRMSAAEMISMF